MLHHMGSAFLLCCITNSSVLFYGLEGTGHCVFGKAHSTDRLAWRLDVELLRDGK